MSWPRGGGFMSKSLLVTFRRTRRGHATWLPVSMAVCPGAPLRLASACDVASRTEVKWGVLGELRALMPPLQSQ